MACVGRNSYPSRCKPPNESCNLLIETAAALATFPSRSESDGAEGTRPAKRRNCSHADGVSSSSSSWQTGGNASISSSSIVAPAGSALANLPTATRVELDHVLKMMPHILTITSKGYQRPWKSQAALGAVFPVWLAAAASHEVDPSDQVVQTASELWETKQITNLTRRSLTLQQDRKTTKKYESRLTVAYVQAQVQEEVNTEEAFVGLRKNPATPTWWIRLVVAVWMRRR